tara:strand:- start:3614 stop:4132 length:519 start_codon:yes stop_codon:yes gene_type:complete
MARITVEDCIDKFPSRFELVLIASNRARKLHSGEQPTIEKDNDKNTVIALREIADETITIDDLKNSLIEDFQTVSISDEEDEVNSENIEDDNEENLIETETSQSEENKESTAESTLESINLQKEQIIEENNEVQNVSEEVNDVGQTITKEENNEVQNVSEEDTLNSESETLK